MTLHMDITRWSTLKSDWLYSLQPTMEKLYTVSKNKTRSWLWLRSWAPYCKFRLKLKKVGKTIQTFRYDLNQTPYDYTGFPDSSVGKESACNAGDSSSIPGSARSAGGGIGYPLQYPWASLVIQLVKNLPTMRKTWVWSLGWEDPMEKGKATDSSILACLENSMGCIVHRVTKSWTQLNDFHLTSLWLYRGGDKYIQGIRRAWRTMERGS